MRGRAEGRASISAHARGSASAAHRWLICAGSLDGPSSPPTVHSATGTFAHDIAARCLQGQGDPSDFLLLKGKVDGFDVVCDQEMVEGVQLYVDTMAEDTQPGDIVHVEMPLLEALQSIDKDLGGTADRVRYRPSTRHLKVTDFKYGAGVYVEAANSAQCKMYALGAMIAIGQPVDTVEVEIVQPRYEGAKPVRSWSFSAMEILDFVAEVKTAIEATRQPNPKLTPGDHCAPFCPKRKTCPALVERQHALMAQDFAVPAEVPVEKIAQALLDIPLVKARIKAIEEYAYLLANQGTKVPGFKLVDKRATRVFADKAEVEKWAADKGLDPYEPKQLLSVAQLEIGLADCAPKGKKKEAKEQLKPFITEIISGTTLVADTDARPEVKRITNDDFTAPVAALNLFG